MNLKKNPIEKYFFIVEKNNFEKKSRKKIRKIFKISMEKSIFPSKIFTWENRFFYWKFEFFQIFFSRFFFKIIFLKDEKIFFDGIFFKVHLLIKDDRFGTIWMVAETSIIAFWCLFLYFSKFETAPVEIMVDLA